MYSYRLQFTWPFDAGETPICAWQSDGTCVITEPEGSGARYQQLNEWYENSDSAFTDATKEAQRHTNSVVFNVFIWCQVRVITLSMSCLERCFMLLLPPEMSNFLLFGSV